MNTYCVKRYMVLLLFATQPVLPVLYGQAPPRNEKEAVVNVYVEKYFLYGHDTTSYTDAKGIIHYSGRDFYMQTISKGTIGGPVHYRFYFEDVNLGCIPCDESHAPYLKDSESEMTDSASVPPQVLSQLPRTYTGGGY